MRIAINHTRFAPHGGIERYIHGLVLRLLDAGHEVHCFVRRFEPHDHPRLHFHRVRALPLGEGWKVLSFAYASALALRGHRFDVVQGFTRAFTQDVYFDGSGTFARYQAFRREPPLAYRLGKFRPLLESALRHIEKRRYDRRNAPLVLAMSELARGQIIERYPHMSDRVQVVHSAVDTDAFHPGLRQTLGESTRDRLGTSPHATVFLSLGSDFRRKGVSTAIRAVTALGRTDVELWVVGHDKRQRRYEEFARRLDAPVRFLGLRADPRPYLAASDALVFPSRYDVFGNAVLEGWASGLPAIVSAAAGASELVAPGNGLVLRDPESPLELTELLGRFLDPDERATHAARARRTAEAHAWSRHLPRVLKAYESLGGRPAY